MKGIILIALSAIAGALPAQAGDKGEFQVQVQIGKQFVNIDGEQLLEGERLNHDGLEIGFALSWRLKRGLLLEASLLHSSYTDFGGIILSPVGLDDMSFDNFQYSGAVGWQFDENRWRFTPKLGVARSKLTSTREMLLNDQGERTDKLISTVPFVEMSAVRRMGEHFALGLSWRETFQDFGHTQGLGVTAHWFFD